jgi:ketosteroid isomerase-like protein
MKNRRTTSAARRDDIAAIRRLAAVWRAGWLAGDADALVALYTRKPVLMPQGRPAIFGKAAIRSLYRAVLRAVRIESTGTYSLRATPKAGGKARQSKGKSVFIVRRQNDGAWKIARLIDNSDR